MPLFSIKDLPSPPFGKTGFPWTEGTGIQYISENLPKISIITPSFNQGQFIEATIRSILLQNYTNLEYIIIDGGSTDETVSIIKKYEKWISYWVSETDNGQSDAINKGLAIATGDVFNWINSDDMLAPNALETIGCFFQSNPEAHIFIGKINNMDIDGQFTGSSQMGFEADSIEKTMLMGSITQPSLFYRLEQVRILRGVDVRLYYCMDIEMWYRYLLYFGASNIVSRDTVLAYFRQHEAAKTHNMEQVFREWLKICTALLESINFSDEKIALLSIPYTIHSFYKKYNFTRQPIHKKRLAAYIFQQMLTFLYYHYPIRVSLRLWQISFSLSPLGRSLYFYTLPLRELYRKMRLKILYHYGRPETIFRDIYKNNIWQSEESVSGIGSTLALTAKIRTVLPDLFKQFEIKSVLDAPCGDFNWVQKLDLSGIQYIGVDIVEDLIATNMRKYSNEQRSFMCLNIISDSLPHADLIFCRDCLPHFSEENISIFLKNLKNSSIKYLLTTTYPNHQNVDIQTGMWRPLNLEGAPFNFPKPLVLINEGNKEEQNAQFDKSLALWLVPEL